ncbi:MAG: hypothetical protein F9K23_15830 [Bacteroidetes bacterium]|nr:MAG: hypothetical protein F9K23_15830 [Bacteroidota bacterium]
MKKGSYGISPLPGNKTFGASDRRILYLLADVPNAAFALATRQLLNTYTGPLVRVRRLSDNAETGILPDYLKSLSDSSATESGQTLAGWQNSLIYGAVWYDQSGNNRFVNQTTASNQYQLIISAKPHFISDLLGVRLWNFGTKLNSTLYGAGKQFTISCSFNTAPPPTGDFSFIYQVATSESNPAMSGMNARIIGVNPSGMGKLSIQIGDLAASSAATIESVTAFSTSVSNNFIIMYDGTENSSVLNRFKVLRNGVSEQMQVSFSTGAFPFSIAAPATNGSIRQEFSSTNRTRIYEMIIWPRILTSLEQQFAANSAKKAYGF